MEGVDEEARHGLGKGEDIFPAAVPDDSAVPLDGSTAPILMPRLRKHARIRETVGFDEFPDHETEKEYEKKPGA
jgi:hypothetical protein